MGDGRWEMGDGEWKEASYLILFSYAITRAILSRYATELYCRTTIIRMCCDHPASVLFLQYQEVKQRVREFSDCNWQGFGVWPRFQEEH